MIAITFPLSWATIPITSFFIRHHSNMFVSILSVQSLLVLIGTTSLSSLIDLTTRYPETTALKRIDTETVAEALLTFFSRIGFPEKITTDQGSQFMSDVMQEVYRLLSIKHQPTIPWHPMSNGVVENYNGSLKRMLKRLCSERVKDWDRYTNACLFANRETHHSSAGFSPFELVQGRTVRGPMSILRELWTKESVDPEIKTTYQYVLDLRERIQDTCELARQELEKVQLRNQGYYNRKTRDRTFQVGEKILLLLPTVHNKMELQWKGPYSVVKKVSNLDYQIKMDNKIKTFHVNMLKRYVERVENVPETMVQTHRLAAVASVFEDEADESDLSLKDSDLITHYTVSEKETNLAVNVNSELPEYCQNKPITGNKTHSSTNSQITPSELNYDDPYNPKSYEWKKRKKTS